jgi:TRAP-type C4-dicarboxylate transport system substrate-binding protein
MSIIPPLPESEQVTKSAPGYGRKPVGGLYVDFRPLAQLDGEKDVLRKLKMDAVQGMLCSSVAAANVAPQLGIVNLPFVVDSFDNLEPFRNTPELFEPFSAAGLRQGIRVLDLTGYGPYGWATTTPVRTLEEARQVNLRIAQAPVNTDLYKESRGAKIHCIALAGCAIGASDRSY